MDNSTPPFDHCVSSTLGRYIFLSWFIAYLLMLPLFLFVFYLGFNKWKTPQSSASGALSHSDVITLNMVVMEITSVVGSCVVSYGFIKLNSAVTSIGGDMIVSTMTGQTLFHSLTCVERYLAVVHPVIYLRLKRGGGVTIRNLSILFVWAFCVTFTLLFRFINSDLFYALFSAVFSFVPLPLVAYCSIYVLCVLTRPKPGERGGPQKIDQSKRSTVYTVVAILAVLLLRLITNVMIHTLTIMLNYESMCAITISSFWAAMPCSLVLPLLFLHRAGKLTC